MNFDPQPSALVGHIDYEIHIHELVESVDGEEILCWSSF